MLWYALLVGPVPSFSICGANDVDAVPSDGGTGWFRAVPEPKALVVPKPLVVPEPPCPNRGVELVVLPNAGLLALLPKLKDEVALLLLLPKALVLPPPNPPVDVPKPPVFVELPKRPVPEFVLAPKGLEAGLLPKREVELFVFPKPGFLSSVSISISSSVGARVEREVDVRDVTLVGCSRLRSMRGQMFNDMVDA